MNYSELIRNELVFVYWDKINIIVNFSFRRFKCWSRHARCWKDKWRNWKWWTMNIKIAKRSGIWSSMSFFHSCISRAHEGDNGNNRFLISMLNIVHVHLQHFLNVFHYLLKVSESSLVSIWHHCMQHWLMLALLSLVLTPSGLSLLVKVFKLMFSMKPCLDDNSTKHKRSWSNSSPNPSMHWNNSDNWSKLSCSSSLVYILLKDVN